MSNPVVKRFLMIDRKETPIVLVTRPQQVAIVLESELRERGFSPLLSPMLKITYFDGVVPSLDGVQALIFTSANGVHSFFLEQHQFGKRNQYQR